MAHNILHAPRPTVLVVDDHLDAADTLADLLLLIYDCTVHVAYSGSEALAVGDRVQPDCVILDVSMPRMDGFETARCIRGRPWGQLSYIVALTAWGDDTTRSHTREAGMDCHLVKPVSIDSLLGAMAHLRC